MTRIHSGNGPSTARRPSAGRPGRWRLQDAKAKLSELVRRAKNDGPQHVTVHGRDEVVVVAAEDYSRLEGGGTGELLIAALQESPLRDVEFEPAAVAMPVRDVDV